MKLWQLQVIDSAPWADAYDVNLGFIVRAKTEKQAREIAQKQSGGDEKQFAPDAWINPFYSTCTELNAEGKTEIIQSNFRAG